MDALSDSDGTPIRVVTSSASQPCTVATTLDRLAVQDGHNVVEIGKCYPTKAALSRASSSTDPPAMYRQVSNQCQIRSMASACPATVTPRREQGEWATDAVGHAEVDVAAVHF